MKTLFILITLFAPLMWAQDPFSEPHEDKVAVMASWEKLLFDDNVYDGKLIMIDGFIRVEKGSGDKFSYYLFVDSESLNYSRPLRCIGMNSKKLNLILSEQEKMSSDDKIKLNGKYVKVLGVYHKNKVDILFGGFEGAFSLWFRNVDRPRSGLVHVK